MICIASKFRLPRSDLRIGWKAAYMRRYARTEGRGRLEYAPEIAEAIELLNNEPRNVRYSLSLFTSKP